MPRSTLAPIAAPVPLITDLLRGPHRPKRRLPILLWITLTILIALGGCATAPPPSGDRADQVIVRKSQRTLELWQNGSKVRVYRIALGDAPEGHKFREGDERTPIGDYVLDWRNPRSTFYKSIHVSYPNERDKRTARLLGYPSPGGMIMIHGQPNHIRSERVRQEYATRDWTNGCIAVQNAEMDEIWRMVRDGTPIRILP